MSKIAVPAFLTLLALYLANRLPEDELLAILDHMDTSKDNVEVFKELITDKETIEELRQLLAA